MLVHIFRQDCQHHYTHRFLSLSFQVPQLLSSRLYSPMFSGREKKTQSCEILIPKIKQAMFLTFSSYSINNLPNYLIFFGSSTLSATFKMVSFVLVGEYH